MLTFQSRPAVVSVSGTPLSSAPPKDRLAFPFSTVERQVPANAPVFPFDEESVREGDQYRILKAKLKLLPGNPRMFIVTSAGPGDGKSTTTINLAGVLSLKGECRVLLVDGDLRWPTVHQQLGIPIGMGLAGLLSGECTLEQAVFRLSELPNLHVLTAGAPSVNPMELIDSLGWRDLCTSLRELFDYVVIDTPPVGAVAEYALIEAQADKVVLVARPDYTKRTTFNAAVRTIAKEKLAGVVLNCVPEWPLARTTDYGYYSYSGAKRTS